MGSSQIRFRAWDGERLRKVNTIGWVDESVDFVTTPRYSGPAEDFILMQYTGLKDKNGVEIYEGDIINYERRGKEQVGIVEYYASACSFLLSDTHLLLSAGAFVPYFVGEVIGNIYENPELSERESK